MTKADKVLDKILKDRKIKQILITHPKPKSDKSPYFDLEKRYGVHLDFCPFIKVEGLDVKEFRKQKIHPKDFTSTIFVSRNAVQHFFRICEELKYKVSPERKYYCASEAVALYLQKFVQYRKRKVAFAADGTPEELVDLMRRYKDEETFFFPVSEHTHNEISPLLNEEGFKFTEASLYRTVSTDISTIIKKPYDIIVLFSPFSMENLLKYKDKKSENDVLVGAFGNNTAKAVTDSGLPLVIKAPDPNSPSMVAAIRNFLDKTNQKID